MKKQEILDAFNYRFACKLFNKDKKISAEDFDTILEAARLSPSSFGYEPWHFVVIQDMDKREKFSKAFWGGDGKWQTASHLVFALSRKKSDMSPGTDYLNHIMTDVHHIPEEYAEQQSAFFTKFQDIDFGMTKYPEGVIDWSMRQAYIPLANMMTTAAMLKIDSCPMEGFNRVEMDEILDKEFGFDKNQYSLAYAVAFGYRASNPERQKSRQSMEEIVTWIK
jgi:nitroreductase